MDEETRKEIADIQKTLKRLSNMVTTYTDRALNNDIILVGFIFILFEKFGISDNEIKNAIYSEEFKKASEKWRKKFWKYFREMEELENMWKGPFKKDDDEIKE